MREANLTGADLTDTDLTDILYDATTGLAPRLHTTTQPSRLGSARHRRGVEGPRGIHADPPQ
jgi:hypothetical protein